jgi:small subunit ribosomal protein S6
MYDVLLIVDPQLTDEEVAQLSGRLQESLAALGGEVTGSENWGKRRLAFELRKHREGHYLLFMAQAAPAVVREYERQLRLNESVLRFLTTRVVERRKAAAEEAPAEPGATPAAAATVAAGPPGPVPAPAPPEEAS